MHRMKIEEITLSKTSRNNKKSFAEIHKIAKKMEVWFDKEKVKKDVGKSNYVLHLTVTCIKWS